MKNILCIPHQPHRNLRVRTLEMAQYLAEAGNHQVFVLAWQPGEPGTWGAVGKLRTRLIEALISIRQPVRIEPDDAIPNLHWVRLPYLLAPWPWCQRFNRRQVTRFVNEHRIEAVINANAYHFPVPHQPGLRYIYDVVDDHLNEGSGPHWRRTRAFTLAELGKADAAAVISHGLQELVSGFGAGSKTHLIPNGVNLAAYRQADEDRVKAIRLEYGLDGRFAIVYIGNHGWWSGLAFLLSVFERFHRIVPDSKLLVVGPGGEVPTLERQSNREGVVFTGPVPPKDVAAWFHATDIGVLPFDLCSFTHHALPLKVLEYGAARKRVLASPLKELETLDLPFVERLPPDVDTWVRALVDEAKQPGSWQPDWDDVVANYDWQRVLSPLIPLLEADR